MPKRRARCTASEVKSKTVHHAHRPLHDQRRKLPRHFLDVRCIAGVLDDMASTRATGAQGRTQFQGPERQVDDVRRHPRCPATTERHERTVFVGAARDERIVRTHGRRSDPLLPVQIGRRSGGWRIANPAGALIHDVERADHADRSQLPAANPLHDPPIVFTGVDLRADLADPLVSLHGLLDREGLGHVQRHRLLQVDVLARLAGMRPR